MKCVFRVLAGGRTWLRVELAFVEVLLSKLFPSEVASVINRNCGGPHSVVEVNPKLKSDLSNLGSEEFWPPPQAG